MPILFNPKTFEERDLWVKVCAAKPGENVDGVTKSQKQRIRGRYYVREGELIDRAVRDEKGIELPAFVECDFQRLWRKHHVEKNHPGRDITGANIETEIAQVSYKLVKNALLDCQICRHKSTAKKAPVGKPISAKGIWQRVGIDLIDMSSRPDGDFKWIYHAKDHVSVSMCLSDHVSVSLSWVAPCPTTYVLRPRTSIPPANRTVLQCAAIGTVRARKTSRDCRKPYSQEFGWS
jgi:hypothetical protein